jgi:hypothetical protein
MGLGWGWDGAGSGRVNVYEEQGGQRSARRTPNNESQWSSSGSAVSMRTAVTGTGTRGEQAEEETRDGHAGTGTVTYRV